MRQAPSLRIFSISKANFGPGFHSIPVETRIHSRRDLILPWIIIKCDEEIPCIAGGPEMGDAPSHFVPVPSESVYRSRLARRAFHLVAAPPPPPSTQPLASQTLVWKTTPLRARAPTHCLSHRPGPASRFIKSYTDSKCFPSSGCTVIVMTITGVIIL